MRARYHEHPFDEWSVIDLYLPGGMVHMDTLTPGKTFVTPQGFVLRSRGLDESPQGLELHSRGRDESPQGSGLRKRGQERSLLGLVVSPRGFVLRKRGPDETP